MTFDNQNRITFINEDGTVFIPNEITDKFNWGAFLLSWIWGLGNKTYISLVIIPLSCIPFIGGIASLGFSIWLGIKGNELAWKNKEFPSIEAFHEYQKRWAFWGVIITVACFVLLILGISAAFMSNTTSIQ